ncbi:hypothetical protein D9758_008611 [Tetrapyrgos nigripes]|uniref:Peroxidase n=1 Tax=Tetrapyrgos nigripes TaxID=182062 RepID=A0A8H5D7N3_9AGAR|nr:hypothetical protein D9758_008611 [Tetrapyrgos nigripes]
MYSTIIRPLTLAAFLTCVAGAATTEKRQVADTIDTAAAKSNPVCTPYIAVRDAIMGDIFEGGCNDNTRAAVRLAFHDAGTFSLSLEAAGKENGGADGSLLVDPDEVLRSENNGLQNIVALLKPMPERFNVSAGDVLHLAGTLAVLACPGGPLVNTFVGRPPVKNINPDGLLPDTHDKVSNLVNRFADMGLTVRETMALIGAHTCARQRFVNLADASDAMDETVDIWDIRFYGETQRNDTDPHVFRLPSDLAFSQDPLTKKDFSRFVGALHVQENWASEYADAHEKMSLLGQNVDDLTDCTEIMPEPIHLKDIVTNRSGGAVDPPVDPAKLQAELERTREEWLS